VDVQYPDVRRQIAHYPHTNCSEKFLECCYPKILVRPAGIEPATLSLEG
jgi:hypothetical protein